jgi:hypothetical protein
MKRRATQKKNSKEEEKEEEEQELSSSSQKKVKGATKPETKANGGSSSSNSNAKPQQQERDEQQLKRYITLELKIDKMCLDPQKHPGCMHKVWATLDGKPVFESYDGSGNPELTCRVFNRPYIGQALAQFLEDDKVHKHFACEDDEDDNKASCSCPSPAEDHRQPLSEKDAEAESDGEEAFQREWDAHTEAYKAKFATVFKDGEQQAAATDDVSGVPQRDLFAAEFHDKLCCPKRHANLGLAMGCC